MSLFDCLLGLIFAGVMVYALCAAAASADRKRGMK